jgi:hypothetical protein
VSTATLIWTNPTKRTDDVALPADEIASVDIYDDVQDGFGPQIIGSVSGPGTSYTTGVLAVGQHVFTVVVRDTTGHSSAASNGASVTVPATLAAPGAVTDLAAHLDEPVAKA